MTVVAPNVSTRTISLDLIDDLNRQWNSYAFMEALMSKYQFEWEIRPIAIPDVDMEASIALNTRCEGSILPETVTEYAIKMANGAVFPYIVVHPCRRQYRVLDGNQRLAAAEKAGRTHVMAYVLTQFDAESVRKFAREANTLNGKQATMNEKIANAIATYNELGDDFSIADAATEYGLTESTVRNAIYRDKVKNALAGYTWMPRDTSGMDTNFTRLHSLMDNLPVMSAAARIMVRYRLTTEVFGMILTELQSFTSEADRLNFISSWEAQHLAAIEAARTPQSTASRTAEQNRVHRFDTMLTKVITTTDDLDDYTTLTALGVGNIGGRRLMAAKIVTAIRRLAVYLPEGTVQITTDEE